ncbi:ATP-grasp domain-containing protein [Candidatus Marimicrobium litorale]|uniref:protein-tyrosine-phosphatase n=1 Tax=Candidatus Marimicrobium litorale TaxID=2518991 RepID=A0ABT3T0Y9_9GAMM|nr:ATP-grasp domain-containing protein [Candidatus Marimicrobium litorale]MCX2975918.1 ATP-grasp domain-containing protein [Candidatus Marimicrobium litorale]
MSDGKRYRVLVLDADMIPALTVSRSLAQRGCHVYLAGHVERPLASRSNAIDTYYQYPDPLQSTNLFVEWLLAHVESNEYDLVVPVTERVVVPLSRNIEKFSRIKIALPSRESLEVALDKSRTLTLAKKVGVPCPHSVTVSTVEQLSAAAATLNFPVVIKPSRSIAVAASGSSQLQVSYAFDLSELESGCEHALKFGPVILQEYFAGDGVGIELIAKQGEIIYSFQHLRLHEVPLTGGGSSLRKSVPVMPDLLEASRKLISALGWNGVAMVEFKHNPRSDKFCLMEINGRFWGSLPLAAAAGADFPAMLFDLEVKGAVGAYPPYRNNVYCRLLSRDMHWYEAILRSDADTRIVNVPDAAGVLKGLGLFLHPRHRYDVQSLLDPLPGLIDIGQMLKIYYSRALAFLDELKFRGQQRKAWSSGEVAAAISSARSILFLCYGNINRSALADVLVRAYAEDSGIVVASAGFHDEEGRPADPVMVEVAAQFDLELGNLRSSCVTPQQLRDSDVIFVMEKRHYDKLLDMDIGLSKKIFLLGAHHGGTSRSVEIEDPYGRAQDVYLACYEQVVEAVDQIKSVIALQVGE